MKKRNSSPMRTFWIQSAVSLAALLLLGVWVAILFIKNEEEYRHSRSFRDSSSSPGFSLDSMGTPYSKIDAELTRMRSAFHKNSFEDGFFHLARAVRELDHWRAVLNKNETHSPDPFPSRIRWLDSGVAFCLLSGCGTKINIRNAVAEGKKSDSESETFFRQQEFFALPFGLLRFPVEPDLFFQTAASAAAGGNLPMAKILAVCYWLGIGCERNPPAALAIWEKAAREGDWISLRLLAELKIYEMKDEDFRRLTRQEKALSQAPAFIKRLIELIPEYSFDYTKITDENPRPVYRIDCRTERNLPDALNRYLEIKTRVPLQIILPEFTF